MPRRITLVLLGMLLFAAVACRDRDSSAPAADTAATPPSAAERVVPLEIMRGPTGSVIAFVEVFIGDQGPFRFALDTGASQTAIDRGLAQRLNLPAAGLGGLIAGIGQSGQGELVRVPGWRIGELELSESLAVSIELPALAGLLGLQGLLGSDLLSRFGRITIDYEQKQLILPGGPTPRPPP